MSEQQEVAASPNQRPVEVLLESLKNFYYTHPEHLQVFLDHTMGRSNVSLRAIDWFVTNYAKKFATFFFVNNAGEVFDADNVPADKQTSDLQKFVVHHEYKQFLRGYQKEWLDPFCRGQRITFEYDSSLLVQNKNLEESASASEPTMVSHITTIGQLNFFKWVIINGVLKFVAMHIDEIETDMNAIIQSEYKSRRYGKRKAQPEVDLSTSSSKRRQKEITILEEDQKDPENEPSDNNINNNEDENKVENEHEKIEYESECENENDDDTESVATSVASSVPGHATRRPRRRRRELSQSASKYLRGSRVGNVIVGRVVSF
jgi:hypothetical protein